MRETLCIYSPMRFIMAGETHVEELWCIYAYSAQSISVFHAAVHEPRDLGQLPPRINRMRAT